jgi:hypothetical protein
LLKPQDWLYVLYGGRLVEKDFDPLFDRLEFLGFGLPIWDPEGHERGGLFVRIACIWAVDCQAETK